MISSAYSYYVSQYGRKTNSKYDTHTRTQLKDSYIRVLKANSQAPTYKIDFSEAAQKYAIDLKEHARQLCYITKDLSDDASGEMIFKKSAQSSRPDAVSAEFIGDSSTPDTDSIDIYVKQLASQQVNTGNFLQPKQRLLKPGTYTFELNINNLTYEFEFDVSDSENNSDIQNKISRLINRSDIGVSCEILTDSLGNTAAQVTSSQTGITAIKPTIFNIRSDNPELMETLGLDRVSSYPSNALYSVNGKEQYSPSNEFILNNTFKITLKNTTPDGPAAISLNTDDNSIADSIEELISGYNSLIAVTASDNHKIFEGNDRLKQEFSRISQTYKATLNNNGLHIEDDGSVSVDRSSVIDAAHRGTLGNVFKELNNFKKALQRKAEDISTNPMNYVNNKIVAYKNPHHPVTDPYNLSAYSGMMFNDYC